MANKHLDSNTPDVQFEYRKKRNAEAMRIQLVAFTLSIFLTLVAFGAVYFDFSKWFIIPTILLLAAIQVVFQLYYFMHMSEKGHEAPQLFLYGGAICGFAIIVGFSTIIWW